MRIHEMRPLHAQSFRQRIHLSDENADRIGPFVCRRDNRCDGATNVIGQRVSGDVVRLDERGIKQIAQSGACHPAENRSGFRSRR